MTFQDSKELKYLIEKDKWTLYDVSNPPKGRAYTWEELEKRNPAESYEIGHQYLFVPIPKQGHTLREAYTPTKGLGPSLTIENPDDEIWAGLEVQHKSIGLIAIFTRLFMTPRYSMLSSPETELLIQPDLVAVRYERLLEAFQKYFRIVEPEELGLTVPIPMPGKDTTH